MVCATKRASCVQDSPLHAMSMVGPEKHQVNERARSGFELAAHWKCDYSALPRLETERKRARSDLALFFYVLKSAPRFLLLTPNVHGLLIDWHWA